MRFVKFLFTASLSLLSFGANAEALYNERCEKETCEAVNTSSCYQTRFPEGVRFLVFSHREQFFILPNRGSLSITPLSGAPPSLKDEDCTLSLLNRPYSGNRVTCPEKQVTYWTFPFPERHFILQVWYDRKNEADDPLAEAILASLIVHDAAGCDALRARYGTLEELESPL